VQPEAVVESAPVEVVNANHARAVPNKAPSPPVVKKNPTTALSPNVITPAKSTPPKGKVIQWP
jgi:hypothetical protein